MTGHGDEAPVLTVVVATRDRPAALASCLGALWVEREGIPLEILVVDDGSSDASSVARAVNGVRGARVVRQRPSGVAAARNTGAHAARAQFIAFTDDDCVVQTGWASALLERLHAGAEVVAGSTAAGRDDDALAVASQLVSNAVFDHVVPPSAPASNVACRRELVLRIPFDESYSRAGDERDWYERLAADGHAIVYEPQAIAHHYPEPRLGAFWLKHVAYGRAAFRFRRRHRRGRLERPRFYAALVHAGFRRGLLTGLAVCVAQVATAIGFLAEASRAVVRR